MANMPIITFNAGELSPHIDARFDVEKYSAGCRVLENFIPRIYGDAERRPGTCYVGSVETRTEKSKLFPFIYSATVAYVVEFYNLGMRFYYNNGRVVGSLAAETTDWATATDYIIGDFVTGVGDDVIYRCIVAHTSDVGGGDGTYGDPDGGANPTDWAVASLTSDNYPIYEILTPYLETDLYELQVKQRADTMWIVHPEYAPRKLTRLSSTSFDVSAITFSGGPFLMRNDLLEDDGITMAVTGYTVATATLGAAGAGEFTITSATDISSLFPTNQRFYVSNSTGNDAAYTVKTASYADTTLTLVPNEAVATSDNNGQIMVNGGTVTLTASAATFEENHVGALFKLVYPRESTIVKQSGTGTSSAIDVKGGFRFYSHDTWTGTVKLQRNEDVAGWEDFRTWEGKDDTRIQYTGTETEDNVQYRINATISSGTFNAEITVSESTQTAIITITVHTNPTTVTGTSTIAAPAHDTTKRWAEGAWSAVQGYPYSMAFFEERACFCGMSSAVVTIWLSESGDYEGFEEGTNDNDSFGYICPSTNDARWIESLESLLIGTSGDEWRLYSNKLDTPLTPATAQVRQQCNYGSNLVQPAKVNEVIFFVDFVSRKVRELVYREYPEAKYAAPDLTALAEHITYSGITSMAHQRNPDSILWCTLTDGSLVAMTYEREQNVIAWAKYPIGGTTVAAGTGVFVDSVVVIPGSAEDQVWLIVQRAVNDSDVRYIEYMSTRDY